MTTNNIRSTTPTSEGQHLATISYDRRFWEVYLEFNDDPRWPSSYRGLLCFLPSENEGEDTVKRTATIIIEDSYEAAVNKARAFENHQLQGLLRSVLPEEGS